jgi:hypothetical protein
MATLLRVPGGCRHKPVPHSYPIATAHQPRCMNNYSLCPRTQRRRASLGTVAAEAARRAFMRVYIEVILTIIGLLGAYVALLPLIT